MLSIYLSDCRADLISFLGFFLNWLPICVWRTKIIYYFVYNISYNLFSSSLSITFNPQQPIFLPHPKQHWFTLQIRIFPSLFLLEPSLTFLLIKIPKYFLTPKWLTKILKNSGNDECRDIGIIISANEREFLKETSYCRLKN